MSLVFDPDTTATKSRVALIQILNLNLRLLEAWRIAQKKLFGAALDIEATLILMAVVAIGAEKLIRTGDLRSCQDLAEPVDTRLLGRCNLSSIAQTTGLNRETVRRRVIALETQGIVVREPAGVRLAEEVLQHPAVTESINTQLRSMTATVNRLRAEGILSGRLTVAGPLTFPS